MHRAMLLAAFLAAPLTILAAAPAVAGYGALARDNANGKYGLSSNKESQRKADDVAIKICGSDNCKIVFRMAARQCGAIALAGGSSSAWGAGKHRDRAAAELAALTNCQKHTKGQCKVRAATCNR